MYNFIIHLLAFLLWFLYEIYHTIGEKARRAFCGQ